jgi:hypothetical protein
MTDEILPADRRLRTLLTGVAIAVVLLASVLFVYALPNYLDYLKGLLHERPIQGKAEFQRLIDVFILTSVLCIAAFVVYLALLGRKVLNSGRFPPPGARVLVDTRILNGDAAARRGKAMLLTAALIALLVLPGLFYLHLTLTDILASLPTEQPRAPSRLPQLDLD